MAGKAGARIVHNQIIPMVRKIAEATDRGVRETAFEVLEDSHNNIREHDAIDTGALLNSGYVATQKKSGRDAAVAKAAAEHAKGARATRRKRKKKVDHDAKKKGPLQFAASSGNPGFHQAKVAYSVAYAANVEFGAFFAVKTYGYKSPLKISRESTRLEDKQFGTAMPPRPFLMPAAEKARVWLPERIAAQIKKAVG